MAIRTVTQPDFEVDTEIEKDILWPDGSKVYVVATGKYYILKSGVFTDAVAGSIINIKTGSFGFTIDGNGSPITTGLKGYITIPYSGTITGWSIISDVTGSVVVDVWKDTYANYPPTIADTIAGSEKPTLTSQNKNNDNTLTTWTTAVTAGDIIAFNIDSVSTITKLSLTINITKT